MSALALVLFAVFGCAPPDPLDLDELVPPSIDVLYPEPGQVVELNEDCELDVLIVVDVDGLELVDFEEAEGPVDGEGHWHGGPDLGTGFCRSFATWCDDYDSDPFPDGTTASIFATLVNNDHQPFGDEVQVEILVEAPQGVDCP